MSERIVRCCVLKQDLPGLDRAPYKNEIGQKIYSNVSKQAWEEWKQIQVRLINTYRIDLASKKGQEFLLKQCAIHFGFEDGEAAQTAWSPPENLG